MQHFALRSTLSVMLLCVNIGNSNIAVGVYSSGAWLSLWRLSTVGSRTADEYEMLIRSFFMRDGIAVEKIEAMAVASVVPELVDTFTRLGGQLVNSSPFFVHGGVETGLDIGIDNSRELGADLVANAVAGYRLVNAGNADGNADRRETGANADGNADRRETGGNVDGNADRREIGGNVDGNADRRETGAIIVDFGTALTFTMVSETGRVLGVAIAPGLNGALKALAGDTAQLPHVKLEVPPAAIGTNTIHSIQSGVVFGFAGLVESMVRRIRAEMGGNAEVIATGGLHHVIADISDCFDHKSPWLHLEGICEIYYKNN